MIAIARAIIKKNPQQGGDAEGFIGGIPVVFATVLQILSANNPINILWFSAQRPSKEH